MNAQAHRGMLAQFLCIWIVLIGIPASPLAALSVSGGPTATSVRPDGGAVCIAQPLAKGELQRMPEAFYLQDGEKLLRLSVGELWKGGPAVAAKAGSFTITLEQADISLPTAKANEDSTFDVLGSDLDFENPSSAASKSIGFDVNKLYFNEVLSMTRQADSLGMTTEYRVGADTFSVTVPWADSKASAGTDEIEISANGQSFSLAAERIATLGQGIDSKSSWEGTELARVLGNLIDSEAFVAAYLTQAKAFYSVFNAASVKCGCWLSCGGCALSLVGYGLSIPALIIACAGSFGLGCVLTLVAHEVEAAAIVVSCTSCFECLGS